MQNALLGDSAGTSRGLIEAEPNQGINNAVIFGFRGNLPRPH